MLANKLIKGDKIQVVAVSGIYFEENKLDVAKSILYFKKKGFELNLSENIFEKDSRGISAGNAEVRSQIFNEAISDDTIKMIWLSPGGSSCSEILDKINYDSFQSNPKIIIGFSDTTLIINAISAKTGLVTFHGTEAKFGDGVYMGSDFSQKEFDNKFIEKQIGVLPKIKDYIVIKNGICSGKLYGGLLLAFTKLLGTSYCPEFDGAILMLESFDKNIDIVKKHLNLLQNYGVFEKISGLIIGYNYFFDSGKVVGEDGKLVVFEDLLIPYIEKYNFPVVKIHEFGHRCPSTFLPIGGDVEINTFDQTIEIVNQVLN